MNIRVTSEHFHFLEAFTSETRVKIIEILNEKPRNIKDMAAELSLSSAMITKHIQKLEEAGIVGTESLSGARGRQKICRLIQDSVTLQFTSPVSTDRSGYSVSIPIGQYTRYQVNPTCGLASESGLIGMMDDPRYFADPEHVKAKHLWFGSGYVEYSIPNYLVGDQVIKSLSITLEICSEAPGYNEDWPSDITFYINDTELGTWTCPGDYGHAPGVFTPGWWTLGTQHGLLKTLMLRAEGTFLDGIRLSDRTAKQLNVRKGDDIRLRIECKSSSEHPGGISLFGSGFGNYNQDIDIHVLYE
ncbi:ArsR/SmtB family transcription factor [Paenibacillus shunpengii]|uniref:ArsR/SmtB family transcription factor n=1 Tax=Paenibacillus shunpengii TaxID=2054424 RepID=A0ABW5SM29_9BACL|nr:ArsR family transcriptional regulator [Paenibacillus sp. PDC88]SDW08165.1 transcriptional regulator, ArsR family [Paenibacillus sp. PDC88]